MKKSKNLLVVFLGLVLSFNLFACNNNESSSNVDNSEIESSSNTNNSENDSSSSTIEDVYELTVSKSKVELVVGEEEQIEVILTKNNQKITEGISLKVADESIVSIDSNYNITALVEGQTTITISAYGQVKTVEVVVSAPEIFLLLDKDNLKLNVNETYKLTPTVNYGTLPSLTYTSLNEDVATVSNDGLVSAKSEGETTIKVSASESLYATCKVVVSNTYELIFPEISQKEWFVGDTIDLNAIVKVNGNSTSEGITIEVNDEKATISGTSITLVKDGVITIDVSYAKSNEKISQTITAYNKISTKEDYINIKNDLKGYYKLSNDIDFNNERIDTIAHYQDGYQSATNGFAGVFDGQGYSLINMSYGYKGQTYANCSAFGVVAETGIIRNTNFINVTLDNRISGSVATINYGTVENCFVECRITHDTTTDANNPIGGIVSKNYGSIKNCVSIINILAKNNVNIGAIVGRNLAVGTISDCYSLANVGVTESANPTANPTNPAAGVITNAQTFTSLSSLNEKVKEFKGMWNVKDNKYPHLNVVNYDLKLEKNEYNTYPGYDVEITGIESKLSYSFRLKEEIAGVELNGNKVIISNDVAINSKIIVLVSNNYDGEEVEITINVNEPSVSVEGPEEINFDLNTKTSSEDDYKKLTGLVFKKGNEEYTGEYLLKSSDEDVFVISNNYVIAKDTGTATLSVIIDEVVVHTITINVHITHVIQTTSDFLAIGNNAKTMSYDYVLDNDLDFNGKEIKAFSSYHSFNNQKLAFTGTFDGQGHTISNFMPSYNGAFHSDGKSDRDISIFGYLTKDAIIKNVNFVKVKLFDRSSIVSSFNYGTIENVYVEATYIKYGGINRTANNPAGVIVAKMAGGTMKNCIVNFEVASDANIYASDNKTICLGSFVGAANAGSIVNCYSICADERINFYSIKQNAATLTNAVKFTSIEEFYNNANLDSFDTSWIFDKDNKLYPSINGISLNVQSDSAEAYNGITFDLSTMVSSIADVCFTLKEANENITITNAKFLANNISEDTAIVIIASSKYALPVEITLTIKNMALVCTSEDTLSFDFIKGESAENEYTKAHNIKVVYENGTKFEGEVKITSLNEDIAKVVGDNIVAVGDGTTKIQVEVLGVVIKEISITSNMYTPIKTVEEFLAINNDAKAMSLKYKLMNDIDFNNMEIKTFSSYASRNNITWKGVFDGQGYSLKNFTVIKATNPASNDLGLFGYMSKGSVIRNTNFINVTISDRGAVIASWVEGVVENCFVDVKYSAITKGTTNANNPSGGAVAKIATGGIVQNIVVRISYDASVTDFTYVGGLASQIAAKDGYLKNCILICDNPNVKKAIYKNNVSSESQNTENVYQYLNLEELVNDTTANRTSLEKANFVFTEKTISHNGVIVLDTNN